MPNDILKTDFININFPRILIMIMYIFMHKSTMQKYKLSSTKRRTFLLFSILHLVSIAVSRKFMIIQESFTFWKLKLKNLCVHLKLYIFSHVN